MLAYAANQKSRRRLSPSTLFLIGAGHAVALGLLVTARMEIPPIFHPVETDTYNVPLPPPPPDPVDPKPQVRPDNRLPPPDSHFDTPPPTIPMPPSGPAIDVGPPIGSTVPDIGPALSATLPPPTLPPPLPAIERVSARAITPTDLLRPPYPEAKRRTGEEASLHLRLSIDDRGRVTAVDPIGTADPAFLNAARTHLARYWRYKPATEDGRAVASVLTITLRFKLEE
ncbi:energy transducer TonB [Sphingomonas humi]|uniref:TonB C-terminal domain-containing protein n=1 Tax=Sphingomonas humi TaxID=335630 RepID=A0ABP7RJN0_9SPHN